MRKQSTPTGPTLNALVAPDLLTHAPSLPLAEEIEYQYAWLVFSLINAVLLLPLIFLRFRGQAIRASSWQQPLLFILTSSMRLPGGGIEN